MNHKNNLKKFTQVPISNTIGKIAKIHCGRVHIIIINENNEIYGCGSNDGGELGLENFELPQTTF